MRLRTPSKVEWAGLQQITPRSYLCGFCGNMVGPNTGYSTALNSGLAIRIHICTLCSYPTIFAPGPVGTIQVPGVPFGGDVESVPQDVSNLYDEARICMSVQAYTSAVLACRKLLMNIAVSQGADPGKTFQHYVEFLADKGFAPPNGKPWVDHIRTKGNEATHEIHLMTEQDAKDLIIFIEMLLKFIYEFPARLVPPSPPSSPPFGTPPGSP